jgi:hypothetical protein
MRDARDDEVIASGHCGDAIGTVRVGSSAVAMLQLAVVGSQPGFDVHPLHRLAAIVGDDAADGTAAKEFDRRI